MERSSRLDGKTYCFGDFRFIPAQQLLMLGDSPVRTGARALDLLHILLIHAGEVVSKEQLMTFAWPDTFVHESNLKVNIAALRRVITRTTSGVSCIATVSGRGYRFVSPLRVYGGEGFGCRPSAEAISGLHILASAPLTFYRMRKSSLSFDVDRFVKQIDAALDIIQSSMREVPPGLISRARAEHYRIAARKAALAGMTDKARDLLKRVFRLRPAIFLTDRRAMATLASLFVPERGLRTVEHVVASFRARGT
ncbi:hypothetical protein FZ934_24365 (plasmid) [Rhizobium grahamii]|uniref:OmpR/PhoB-type domain-containing protein n=3 Tax=Rhizobium TaxID=379 RepID=A0A5Q0CDK9_9HYPH|nr:hypothetical protein FZ934_24365 [Rhizobium grahamii]QRM53028.1 hypothetical protein F3Y33_21280 [Rhizobium sp. BG6]